MRWNEANVGGRLGAAGGGGWHGGPEGHGFRLGCGRGFGLRLGSGIDGGGDWGWRGRGDRGGLEALELIEGAVVVALGRIDAALEAGEGVDSRD